MRTRIESWPRHALGTFYQVLRYTFGVVIVLNAVRMTADPPGTFTFRPQDYGPAEIVRLSIAPWAYPVTFALYLAGFALLGWAVSITRRRYHGNGQVR